MSRVLSYETGGRTNSRQEREGCSRYGKQNQHCSSLHTYPPPIKKIREVICIEPRRPKRRHALNPEKKKVSDYEQRRDLIELIVLKYHYVSSRWILETKAKLENKKPSDITSMTRLVHHKCLCYDDTTKVERA